MITGLEPDTTYYLVVQTRTEPHPENKNMVDSDFSEEVSVKTTLDNPIIINVPGDQPTIQAAIDAADDGYVIIVAPDTYSENINFLGKAITVKSTDPNNTTIVSTTIIDGNEEASVVSFNNGEESSSVLDGFTVQNGEAEDGAGIYCYESSPSISNCNIISNSADKGGGIYCYKSSPSIANCTFSDNSAEEDGGGGGIYCQASSPNITNCTFSDNSATGINSYGAGIYCLGSSPSIANCTIKGNWASEDGGGIYCEDSSPSITNCTIIGNWADDDGGAISCLGSSPSIANCTIIGNDADDVGAGIYCCEASLPNITNCTISGNSAIEDGGGIYCQDSSPSITNSILWNNLPDEIYVSGNSSPTIIYSDIQGGYDGTDNIDADPLFVSNGQGNYYLQTGSPCIDQGTSAGAPSQDREGISRPQGMGTDMGAYEYLDPTSYTPRASFTANQTTGIDSLTVAFDAGSSGGSQYPGGGFSWDFGDGSTGNGLHVSHTYTNYGAYNVSLTVTTDCGSHRLVIGELIKIKSSSVTKEVGEGFSYSSIQDAIDDAVYGEIILVHDGTYVENIDFMGKAITVRSENGAGATIIDGNDDDNCVIFNHGEGADSVFNGFTLQNGSAGDGGGIGCDNSSPSIANCTIRGNSVERGGGGIYCEDSSPSITNCAIIGNSAGYGGGIACGRHSSPSIDNCTISDNSAGEYGSGGISCWNFSSPSIADCTISDNSADEGGGIACWYSSSPSITNCTISGNSAEFNGGGISSQSSSPTITNCTIRENSAGYNGGGIYSTSCVGPLTLTDCTIKNNSSNPQAIAGNFMGGGIYFTTTEGELVLHDCLISDNSCFSHCYGWNCSVTSRGGGIYIDADAFLANCIVKNNLIEAIEHNRGGFEKSYSYGGGIYQNSGSLSLVNCIISHNSVNSFGSYSYAYGGGIFLNSGSLTLYNCTISHNKTYPTGYCHSSYAHGGGVYNSSGTVIIKNSIGYFNSTYNLCEETHEQIFGDATVSYSDIQGYSAGEASIDADPLFMNPNAGDYHLLPASPCIDSADPNFSLPEDKDGMARPQDGDGDGKALSDMGAYEYYDDPMFDSDGDGLSDELELDTGTDPYDADTDDDGLTDGNTGSEDLNANGILDQGETDPLNPDTDGDGIYDGTEKGLLAPETNDTDISAGFFIADENPLTTTDPTDADSDDDGILDGDEDKNHNGLYEPSLGETDPLNPDSDEDDIVDTLDNCPPKLSKSLLFTHFKSQIN